MPMGTANGAAVSAAAALANKILDRLTTISDTLTRQLELAESSRKNYLASGSVSGGGTVGVAPISRVIIDNYRRRGLSVQNIGAAGNLSIGLGQTQPQINTGITLLPGTSWDGRVSGQLFLGDISLVGSQAGVQYTWMYQ